MTTAVMLSRFALLPEFGSAAPTRPMSTQAVIANTIPAAT